MTSGRKTIELDSENRLIITDTIRKTVKGASYEVDTATTGGDETFLRKTVLNGAWALTPEHNLEFKILGSESAKYGKTLILRGGIECVNAGGLTFKVEQCDTISGMRTGSVELKGAWRADKNNLISLNVIKSGGKNDVLVFQGTWQLNKYNEITYTYAATSLKRRTKYENTLVFKGQWDLGRNKITYRFEGSDNSFFEFQAELDSDVALAASGAIKYQVGVKYQLAKVYRRERRLVTIYGKWKLSNDYKVGFEVTYSGSRQYETGFFIEKLIGENGNWPSQT